MNQEAMNTAVVGGGGKIDVVAMIKIIKSKWTNFIGVCLTPVLKKHSTGFTLIELIIYIALITIFITGAIFFAWDIIHGQIKSTVQRDIDQNLRLVSKRIIYEIRDASQINSLNGSTLSLANIDVARNPTVFDLYSGRLRIGYGTSGPCPVSAPCNLTGNTVIVSNLLFTNLSSGTESAHVKFTLTINSNSQRQEWQYNQVYTGSAELRLN